jgi:hypothetical protein
VTLLSTIVAFLARWALHCCLAGRGPLSTLIPSVCSLKEVGARNHLLLWGDKFLSSRLKTLSDGAKDRSSRQRIDIDAGPGVSALLRLMLLLVLV